jgi:hypothetical protein
MSNGVSQSRKPLPATWQAVAVGAERHRVLYQPSHVRERLLLACRVEKRDFQNSAFPNREKSMATSSFQ